MVRLAAAAERKCPAQLSKSNGNGGSRLANVSAFPRALLLSFIRDGTSMLLTVFGVTQQRKLVLLPALPCAKNSQGTSVVNCSRPRVSSIDRRLQCSSSV